MWPPATINMQFVIFKLMSYCFEETKGFDIKASFASYPESRLIRWYNEPGDITNKRILIKGYSVSRDFSWIENYKLHAENLPKKSARMLTSLLAHTFIMHETHASALFLMLRLHNKNYLQVWNYLAKHAKL